MMSVLLWSLGKDRLLKNPAITKKWQHFNGRTDGRLKSVS